jgi:hypothetical protein
MPRGEDVLEIRYTGPRMLVEVDVERLTSVVLGSGCGVVEGYF